MAESLSIVDLPSFCFDSMLFVYFLYFSFREEMPSAPCFAIAI
jgi:hypothetical protein